MRQTTTHFLVNLGLAVGLLLPGWMPVTVAGESGMARLDGSIWYRERMALPPNAEIVVHLEDVARTDAPSEVIATERFGPEGGPPWAFSIVYDPASLHQRGRYVMRVRIEADGRLLFTNTESIPAFDRASGEPLKILVRRVGGQRQVARPSPARELVGGRWELVEIDGQPAGTGAGGRRPDLQFTAEGQVGGFAGCNRFNGGFEREGDVLSFGLMMSTMMACAEDATVEPRYLGKLVGKLRFSIDSDQLVLYGGDDSRPVLRFEAVPE